jgi:hypothetical protein
MIIFNKFFDIIKHSDRHSAKYSIKHDPKKRSVETLSTLLIF